VANAILWRGSAPVPHFPASSAGVTAQEAPCSRKLDCFSWPSGCCVRRSGARGRCSASSGLRLADMLVLGIATSIDFTVSPFFATAVFPEGAALAETKMGALLSVVAAPLALVARVSSGRVPPRRRQVAHGSSAGINANACYGGGRVPAERPGPQCFGQSILQPDAQGAFVFPHDGVRHHQHLARPKWVYCSRSQSRGRERRRARGRE